MQLENPLAFFLFHSTSTLLTNGEYGNGNKKSNGTNCFGFYGDRLSIDLASGSLANVLNKNKNVSKKSNC